jgi:hypothetical protein
MFTNGIWIGLGIVVAIFVIVPLGLLLCVSIIAAGSHLLSIASGGPTPSDEAARRKALGYDTPEHEKDVCAFLANNAERERARVANTRQKNINAEKAKLNLPPGI